MIRITSRCCICGKDYKVLDLDREGNDLVSHGYCSTCSESSTTVQLLVWDNEYHAYIGECGFLVGKRLYYEQAFVPNYIHIAGEVCVWDGTDYKVCGHIPNINLDRAREVAKENDYAPIMY